MSDLIAMLALVGDFGDRHPSQPGVVDRRSSIWASRGVASAHRSRPTLVIGQLRYFALRMAAAGAQGSPVKSAYERFRLAAAIE